MRLGPPQPCCSLLRDLCRVNATCSGRKLLFWYFRYSSRIIQGFWSSTPSKCHILPFSCLSSPPERDQNVLLTTSRLVCLIFGDLPHWCLLTAECLGSVQPPLALATSLLSSAVEYLMTGQSSPLHNFMPSWALQRRNAGHRLDYVYILGEAS